jgi:NADH-ubiquinone oxidoreductase chain 2
MIIFSIIFILISIAVNNRRDISIIYNRIIALTLLCSLYLIYININILKTGIILFNGLFFLENYSIVFIFFIIIISIFILLITSFYPRKFLNLENNLIKNKPLNILFINRSSEQFRILEYPLLLVFCISGAIFLISSSDIVSIFLSIELQSYSLYLISAIYRNSEYSVGASLMYFLLGSLSSCIILLGISLLYINIGNTNLENIFIINSISVAYNSIFSINNEGYMLNDYTLLSYVSMQYLYIQIAFLILSVGFLFKISAAPFHFWSPDVYNAVPTIVTTFIAIVPKISILILFYNFINYTTGLYWSWLNNIIMSVILSLIIGSVLGLTQYKIKRLFAYSTISHLGFILLSLCINNIESSKAFFFYLIQYSISNLNAFIILISIGYTLYLYTSNINIKDSINSPIQYIYQLKGYFYINPIISISFIITLFSFVGIPPMIGFFAKQMILNIAITQGYIFTSIIAITTSVISAVYYLMIVKNLFFFNPKVKKSKLIINNNNIISKYTMTISSYYSLLISILTLYIFIYIYYDQEFMYLLSNI